MPAPVAASVAEGNMPDLSQIAGVVLAGGRSSRMGKNKALLEFKGRPLVQHMIDILRDAGLKDIFISGSLEGYSCINDEQLFAGPVQGIRSVLQKKPDYKGYLFVPVDMPLLPVRSLQLLLEQESGGYFIEWPLPAYVTPPFVSCHSTSVHDFLQAQGIYPIALPSEFENTMKNANTPQEWEEIIKEP